MACRDCRHWDAIRSADPREWHGAEELIEQVEKETGYCTLSPDWRETTGLHYCSQFSPSSPSVIGHYWASMHRAHAEAKMESAKRIALEKKIKDLRAKLRDLKEQK